MSLIPIASDLYQTFSQLAEEKRMIFMAGLPGVGKSLLIQQLTEIAKDKGRIVHLLHWNTARKPFEVAAYSRFPERDGVTHPVVRKAVGDWARHAVADWSTKYPDDAHLLIGELPLIGSRFIEFAEMGEDEAEDLLVADTTRFIVPVPSWEVREVIEAARAKTADSPQNDKERMEAPPDVLRQLWQETNAVARQMGLTKVSENAEYNPYVYGGVYQALLTNRRTDLILIEQVLQPNQSVYELTHVRELTASAAEVHHYLAETASTYSQDELSDLVSNWHGIITDHPLEVDRGESLRLPLPEQLVGLDFESALTDTQREALREIVRLPLEAESADTLSVLNRAIELLSADTQPVLANVQKFDIYDSYFNVTRTDQQNSAAYLAGLLQAYRNVLANLDDIPHDLTVIETPLLRMGLETAIRPFL